MIIVGFLSCPSTSQLLPVSPHSRGTRPNIERTIISRNRPADFRFVNKIIHPCGDINKYDKSVNYQDILNFIDVVEEKLEDATKNMVRMMKYKTFDL